MFLEVWDLVDVMDSLLRLSIVCDDEGYSLNSDIDRSTQLCTLLNYTLIDLITPRIKGVLLDSDTVALYYTLSWLTHYTHLIIKLYD